MCVCRSFMQWSQEAANADKGVCESEAGQEDKSPHGEETAARYNRRSLIVSLLVFPVRWGLYLSAYDI